MKDIIICDCEKIKKSQIVKLINNGTNDLDDLIDESGAGIACGVCIERLEDLLEEILRK
jgi:NAD(P)H-nitrite reductase large subunit